ncbi:hypothetical protein PV10_06916 [Exophiala mesophila]|uniref:TauD/TfdA-like domain-containing protein n=1 Tax=Exophiala mesophila TaxID=212818 RepID=A0A0D1ZRZ9_EXOME|nr:uncharacterized protein PV10_06916 [Exophiala mesophila]KIV89523.1 hypothetical protein PV10_06916 [Exophiala mesophila]
MARIPRSNPLVVRKRTQDGIAFNFTLPTARPQRQRARFLFPEDNPSLAKSSQDGIAADGDQVVEELGNDETSQLDAAVKPKLRYHSIWTKDQHREALNNRSNNYSKNFKVGIQAPNPPRSSSSSDHGAEGLTQSHKEKLVAKGQLFPSADSTEPLVSPILLREACKCDICVDPSDRQRNYEYSDIPTNINVATASKSFDGEKTIIGWENDVQPNHFSVFDQATTSRLLQPFRNPAWQMYERPRKVWTRKTFRTAENVRIDFNDYMSDDETLARTLHLLWRDGLVFLDGVPEAEESVQNIVTRIGPLQNTFYGNTWDVKSKPQAKNVAYTSKHLGFHMDLLYMKDPPGLQFLHCVHNTCEGGESRFADTLKAIDIMSRMHNGPEMIQTLMDVPVRYEYDNDNFFYSDTKPTIMTRNPTPRQNVLHARNQDLISQIEHVYWSPPFVGNLDSSLPHSKLEKFIRASAIFSKLLNHVENVYSEKMDSGTCVIFDNQRVVHARNSFDLNSGKRWLRGAYLGHQDFVSKAVSMMSLMPQVTTAQQGEHTREIARPEWHIYKDVYGDSGIDCDDLVENPVRKIPYYIDEKTERGSRRGQREELGN